MENEEFTAKPKKSAKGFGITIDSEITLDDVNEDVDPILEEEIIEETSVELPINQTSKRHVPLVRPMPRKKSIPQRGSKGATQLRP